MLKIAICEDEKLFSSQIHEIIDQTLAQTSVLYSISCFSSGEELILAIENRSIFDIAFLDIGMKGMSGVELGAKLREYMQSMKTFLIYVSSYDNRAKEVFCFNTHRFLSKPIEYPLFEEALLSAYNLWKDAQSKCLTLKDPSLGFISLALRDILYIEVTRSHRVDFITDKQRFTAYEKISDLYDQLSSANFLQIHHTCLINYDYIQQMTYDKVTMTDGRTLPISGPKRKDVRNHYSKLRKHQVAQQWP
ncbi:MAG: LytR/AlgR family response regulator transcription factor [Lachnospiraceae bacterium]